MNEAAPEDPLRWAPLQALLVETIRANAPAHTIIAAGPFWNSVDGLLLLTPLADANVIYNFHFYEPFIFSHQGAGWINETTASLRAIPYPSGVEQCQQMPTFQNDDANGWAWDYCNQNIWDASTVDAKIREAADWAAQHGVYLTANEFGVLPTYAPYRDRLQWLRDVRTSFERYNIGWSIWGYDDAFGLDYFLNNQMDAAVLQALVP
jgi:hypothetical protein